MLKLVHYLEMNLNSVKNYNDNCDFKSIDSDIGIMQIDNGPQKYYDWMSQYDPYFYYLVDDINPTYILGYGNIHSLDLKNDIEGHISYGIRHTQRKKGYGTILLELLLKKCEEFGMSKVSILCSRDNIASYKVIKKNNGILEREYIDYECGKKVMKFWIKLHPKINDVLKRVFKKID